MTKRRLASTIQRKERRLFYWLMLACWIRSQDQTTDLRRLLELRHRLRQSRFRPKRKSQRNAMARLHRRHLLVQVVTRNIKRSTRSRASTAKSRAKSANVRDHVNTETKKDEADIQSNRVHQFEVQIRVGIAREVEADRMNDAIAVGISSISLFSRCRWLFKNKKAF